MTSVILTGYCNHTRTHNESGRPNVLHPAHERHQWRKIGSRALRSIEFERRSRIQCLAELNFIGQLQLRYGAGQQHEVGKTRTSINGHRNIGAAL